MDIKLAMPWPPHHEPTIPAEDDGKGTTVLDRPPEVVKQEDPATKLPPMYHVWLLNDDFTPYQVVIWVIKAVFNFSDDEATRRMLTAHRGGRALMGTFAKDIAETKAEQIPTECKQYGDFPLQAAVEEAPPAD